MTKREMALETARKLENANISWKNLIAFLECCNEMENGVNEEGTTEEQSFNTNNKSIDKEKELEIRIYQMLNELGVPTKLSGYRYIKEAIKMVYNEENDINIFGYVTKTLYPGIAKKFSVNAGQVECGIRNAIDRAWTSGNTEFQAQLFGYTISSVSYKPTNWNFIKTIVEYFKLQDML